MPISLSRFWSRFSLGYLPGCDYDFAALIFTLFLTLPGCGSTPNPSSDELPFSSPVAEPQRVSIPSSEGVTTKVVPALIAQRLSEKPSELRNKNLDSQCPIPSLGESELDCPWAGISRTLEIQENITDVIKSYSPLLYKSIQEDQKEKTWLSLWGRSVNFDEGAKAQIVNHRFADWLTTPAGFPPQSHSEIETVHAGLMHTYGYLFSNLKTPFGFKRARWVNGEIERGFGFSTKTLSPQPPYGSLFSNLTYLAGKFAFRGHSSEQNVLDSLRSRVSPELFQLDPSQYNVTSVQETVQVEKVIWIIQTDFVEFSPSTHPPQSTEQTSNSHLLIYSLHRPETNSRQLITIFPVSRDFVNRQLDPTIFGASQPIALKFNAFQKDLYAKPLRGRREIKVQ